MRQQTRQSMTGLLSSYPRTRPALTAEHERIFAAEYRLNREGAGVVEGLAQRMEAWMHRRVAERAGKAPTLELGAGTLNHLKYEPVGDYDVVEPFTELLSGSPWRQRVRRVYPSQNQISLRPTYHRIISVAVLEHMTDLPNELARAGLLLKPDGLFQAGIPIEGGFLWWLGWRCTTGVSYWLRNRLDYGVIIRHEHVNSASEILALICHFFREVTVLRFPFPHEQLSLYAYIEARVAERIKCEELLDGS